MDNQTLLDEARRLSPADRLELIDALWRSLAPEDVPVTSDERRLVGERLWDLEEHPDAERPWEAVRADMYARLK
ncbi:MAG: addiction module protein [Lacisediminihabitans sp.]